MTDHPAYDEVRQVTPYAAVVVARNPGPMTLDGTNTWLLGDTDGLVVVDPGPDDAVHLELVADRGRIERVLLTHRHADHSEGARRLYELSGAPVYASDPEHRHGGGGDLVDDYVIEAGGLRITVLTTPGHTSDSVSLLLDDGSTRAVLTGDTILGRGTTVVAHPDGLLADYLASLRRLAGVGDAIVLPGHGPELPSIVTAAEEYLVHRAERLDQVRAALDRLGPRASPRQIVADVYADVDRSVWPAAELSVRAQLDYLRSRPAR
ncbi:MAG: MBL fold metallo-hydrolase [Actinomycetota bacterium]|nr:MBL fold metallo-hydrolase [Actinomycetota bacterium]